MENIGYAALQVIPSMKGAKAAIERDLGSDTGQGAGRRVGMNISTGIGRAMKGAATGVVAAGAAGIGVALTKGMGRLVAIDNATAKLRGLGHSAKDIAGIMDNVGTAVTGTAFGLDEAATAAASALSAGIKPGKELADYLTLIGDAATQGGTSFNEMAAIINKTTATGKVGLGNLNQLSERGIGIMAWLADEYGVSGEELAKMVSRGEVDTATFRKVLNDNIGGAAQESGNTFSGAMANIGAALGRVGARFLGGVFPKMAPLFQSISGSLKPVEEGAGALGNALADRIGPVIERITEALDKGFNPAIKGAGQVIGPAVGAFVALGASGLSPLLKMVPGLGGFGSALGALGGPVGIVVAAFAGLIATSPELRAAVGDVLAALVPAFESLVSSVLPAFTEALGNILPVVAEMATALAVGLAGALEVVAPIVTGLVGGLVGLLGPLTSNETAVRVLIGALIAWKAVGLVGTIVGLVASLSGKATALWASTTAWIANTKAMLVSKAETLYLKALYGIDMVKAIGRYVAMQASLLAAYAKRAVASAATVAGMVAQRVAMVAVTAASKAWAAAQWLVNAAMSANPLGLIVVLVIAVVAAIVLLWKRSETFRNIVLGVWSAIQGAIRAVADWVTGTLVPALSGAWDSIMDALRAAGDFIAGIWDGIKETARAAWDGVVSLIKGAIDLVVKLFMNFTLPGLLMKHWGSITKGATNAWNGIVNFVSKVPGRMWNGLKAIGTTVRTNVVNAARRVRDTAKAPFDGLVGFVGKLPGRIKRAAKGMWEGIKVGLKGAINSVIDAWNRLGQFNINISVPSWVPGIGGYGFKIDRIFPAVPRLADGGVTTGPMLAMIGDNPGGREAVIPLDKYDLFKPMPAPSRDGDGGPRTEVNVEQHNYYPQAEPESKTIDRAHELLGLAGAL